MKTAADRMRESINRRGGNYLMACAAAAEDWVAEVHAGYAHLLGDGCTDTLHAVMHERTRQEVLWPGKTCAGGDISDGRKLAILTEEVGEVAKEMNDADNEGRDVSAVALRTELIQVAAVAVAWAEAL